MKQYIVIFKNVVSIHLQNEIINIHFEWLKELLEINYYYNVRDSVFKIGNMFGYTIELNKQLMKQIEERPEIYYIELDTNLDIQF